MKKLIALTILCFAVFGLTACSEPKEPKPSEIPNPIVVVDSASALADMGLPIDAPAGASDVVYSTINEQSAQVEYVLDGKHFTFRCSQVLDSKSLHGIYDELTLNDLTQDLTGKKGTAHVETYTIVPSGSALATTDVKLSADAKEPISLTLTCSQVVTSEEIMAYMISLTNALLD